MACTHFVNARVVLPGGRVAPGSVRVRGGRIDSVELSPTAPPPDSVVVDVGGRLLSPGLIDVQVNGGWGVDLSDSSVTVEAVLDFARHLLSTGVTAFCPTVISAAPGVYARNLPIIRQARDAAGKAAVGAPCARLLGCHLEGPYLHVDRRGAHRSGDLRVPQTASMGGSSTTSSLSAETNPASALAATFGEGSVRWDAGEGDVGLVTLAPELPGALDVIRWLSAPGRNVVASIGHTSATYAQAAAAVEAGATMLTHVFNAMPPLLHREPGPIGLLGRRSNAAEAAAPAAANTPGDNQAYTPYSQAPFLRRRARPASPSPFFGLIADGVHVHPAAMAIAYRANPARCVAVTDAMRAMGLEAGRHRWNGGDDVEVFTGAGPGDGYHRGRHVVVAGTSTLAGAVLPLDACVRNLRDAAGLGEGEALATATENPARLLGLLGGDGGAAAADGFPVLGAIVEGACADLVVFDDHMHVAETYLAGVRVYSRSS
jgi:N-acetylglucosamine-6-phosphate deacetylase